MKAIQWIDEVKQRHGVTSDYAAAKVIGVSRFTVSGYRNREGSTLDDEAAYKVALALDINPAGVVLDQVAERSKSPAVAAALRESADRLLYIMLTAKRYLFDSITRPIHAGY